jgi:MoaA/NifB/PqqE/SkfB family radical SAM enzyme
VFLSATSSANLLRGLVLRDRPIYVQYYVTARCNLTCKQCNIIYADAALPEATAEQADRIAENLSSIGLSIVLLTGGEPFMRQDLHRIVASFEGRGIHVRTQTNGLATEEQLRKVVAAGARDVSVSLDSLSAVKQDFLNGSYQNSWTRALDTIARITTIYPARHSFAAFGTVLSPHNILEIPNIIRFATEIGWYVSLVPAHIADPAEVFNFRSYDQEMLFPPELYPVVDAILAECAALKRAGGSLYDSFEYLDNIRRFIRREPVTWRRRNDDLCDSPSLYFAIRPNGHMAVCCDHELEHGIPVFDDRFPAWYRDGTLSKACLPKTRACPGCMYGSYPEISISSHYARALLDRGRTFLRTPRHKPWPVTSERLSTLIDEIQTAHPVDHSLGARLLRPLPKHADATYVPGALLPSHGSPPRPPSAGS